MKTRIEIDWSNEITRVYSSTGNVETITGENWYLATQKEVGFRVALCRESFDLITMFADGSVRYNTVDFNILSDEQERDYLESINFYERTQ